MEINTNGVPNWLAQAALARAFELLEPSVLDIYEDDDTEEGEED